MHSMKRMRSDFLQPQVEPVAAVVVVVVFSLAATALSNAAVILSFILMTN
jgi:hypothetical protein